MFRAGSSNGPDITYINNSNRIELEFMKSALIAIVLATSSVMSQKTGISVFMDSLTADSSKTMFEYATNSFIPKSAGGLNLAKAFANDSSGIIGKLYYFAAFESFVGKPCDKVIEDIGKREQYYLSQDGTMSFAPSPLPSIGDSAAPVRVVAFVSGTCPVCKHTCTALYDAITQGSLKGIAHLTLKPAGQSDADPAMVAAATMGDFWDYFNSWQAVHGEVDRKKILKVATQVGFDRDQFTEIMSSDSIRKIAADSRREALADGMEFTPTIYINGRLYSSSSRSVWVIDAIDWEYRHILKK